MCTDLGRGNYIEGETQALELSHTHNRGITDPEVGTGGVCRGFFAASSGAEDCLAAMSFEGKGKNGLPQAEG